MSQRWRYPGQYVSMREHDTPSSAWAVAREYFADSGFLPVGSFGDGWLQAGELGVFDAGALAGARGRQAIALRHTLGASSAAWKLPEERRSA